ncbi:MAG: class I SAM-dependent methyltransferase [Sumerlaeia bacterium]
MAWYKNAFTADYMDRYAHRSADEARQAVESLLAATDLRPGDDVMDLCCGAGRHSYALWKSRLRVTGFDLSQDLLASARESLRCQGENCPRLIRGDMRVLPFAPGSFAAVAHFFTAFGYFERDSENYLVFEEVARVLRPGGWYLLDFLNAHGVEASFGARLIQESETTLEDGTRIRSEKRLTDPPGRRVEKREWITTADGSPGREIHESVRLFRPDDLRPALTVRGLAVVEEWGGYGREPWTEESGRFIALCRRKS